MARDVYLTFGGLDVDADGTVKERERSIRT
jgi:hypothetical protein